MALMRWEPFREMMSLRDAMDRLFEESFLVPRRREMPAGTLPFPLDVIERDDRYEVKATLPGIKPDEVEVTITGNTLTIRGERKEEREEKEENYLVRESSYGTFSRRVDLPSSLDAEHSQATFENGVLTLSVPKAAEAKPKRIAVKAASALATGGQERQVGKK